MQQANAALFIIMLVFIWMAVKTGCIGLGLYLPLRYPVAHQRMLLLYQTRPHWCFFIGLLNSIVAFLVFAVLAKVPGPALIGVFLLAALIATGAAGYSLAYRDFAERLQTQSPEAQPSPLHAPLLLEAAYMAPIAGQILSILTFFRGIGAIHLSLLSRRAAP